MATSDRQALYERYIQSMERTVAHKRTCWRVVGYRHDKFPGRWEIVLGTGRSMGPFTTAQEAMQRAIDENSAWLHGQSTLDVR